MFTLVIIDDEPEILNGLSNLVNWSELGFEILSLFSDGQKCLDWLQVNDVDVILTDLKLGSISGLDLATFVCNNKPYTKIVLLSGYSDFSAAQTALELHVTAFLSKPISPRKLKDLFARLYREMTSNPAEIRLAKSDYNTILDFSYDLFSGRISENQIMEKYRQILIGEDRSNLPMSLVIVAIGNYNEILNSFDSIYDFKKFVTAQLASLGDYMVLHQNTKHLYFLSLSETNEHLAINEHKLKCSINSINSIINIALSVNSFYHFSDYIDMIKHIPQAFLSEAQKIDIDRLENSKNQIVVAILENDINTAKALYASFIDTLISSPKCLFDESINLFSSIINCIYHHQTKVLDLFPYSLFMSNKTKSEFINSGNTALDNITQSTMKLHLHSKNSIVSSICVFIDKNYNQTITVESLANQVYISPAYLSRIFKDIKHETIIQYLIDKRMENACCLLLSNDKYTVSQISSLVGYSNTKYFFNLFSKRMNCTPKEYIRRAQLNSTSE